MTDPADLIFFLMQTVMTWARRALNYNPDLAKNLQATMKDPQKMIRLMRYLQAGCPEPPPPKTVCIYEPSNHSRAREILGKNFLGLDVAQRVFGPYSEAQLQERLPLRLFHEKEQRFLSEEDTLRVIEKHKATHGLAATHPLSLADMHRLKVDHFYYEIHSPGADYDWGKQTIAVPWLLFRKEVVPNSFLKRMKQQKVNLKKKFPAERMMQPCEYGYLTCLSVCSCRVQRYHIPFGKYLYEDYVVRFPVAQGERRYICGRWHQGALLLQPDEDRGHYENVVSASVWAG